MKNDCECFYCKNKVDEYFCIACGYNFNECESFFEYIEPKYRIASLPGIQMCPKCHPEDFYQKIPDNDHNKKNIFRKIPKELSK